MEKVTQLWYRQPASDWNEALPLGNGRLGGMVFGAASCEQIQVNEDSVWYGGPMDRNNPSAKEKLPQIRSLILEGRIHEAERLCKQAIGGTPQGMRIYQTLGDIAIDYDLQDAQVTQYERGLDVADATAYVHFMTDETLYERTFFISEPAQVMVMRLTAKGKHKMNLEIMQTRHHIYDFSCKAGKDSIILGGNLGKNGLDYAMMCKAVTKDGEIEVIGESITVRKASEVILYWSAGTTYRMQNLEKEIEALLNKAADRDYEVLYREHVADYHAFYERMKLTIDGDEDRAQLPTDRRLAEYAQGVSDKNLEQLYFNFGRYLMISCSRPGTLPATLQGIWNKDMEAPWDAKYTININTEMNYWCAEPCDLGIAICLCLIYSGRCCRMVRRLRSRCMDAGASQRITIRISGEIQHRRIYGFPGLFGSWAEHGSARISGCIMNIHWIRNSCGRCFQSCGKRHSFSLISALIIRVICALAPVCHLRIPLFCRMVNRGLTAWVLRWIIRFSGICLPNAIRQQRYWVCRMIWTGRSQQHVTG